VVLGFGFGVSTVTAIVIEIVIVVDVPVLVPASLLSSVYTPPASVSVRLGARK
jgi:hypothetical protein